MCPNMLQGSYEGSESKSEEVDAKATLLTYFLFFQERYASTARKGCSVAQFWKKPSRLIIS